jgi:hypothetical protein
MARFCRGRCRPPQPKAVAERVTVRPAAVE